MVKVGVASLLSLALGLAQLSSVDAWTTPKPVQAIFPKKTLQTVVAFIPERNSAPELTLAQAQKMTTAIFKDYGVANRFNEYSSGAIKMTGVGSDPLPTVKYIDKGVDSCDPAKIIDTVKEAISPLKPDRVIVMVNKYIPTCFYGALAYDNAVLVFGYYLANPGVMFHELGHTLGLPHPGTPMCYSNGKQVMMSNNCTTVDSEYFQNMGEIQYSQPWLKSDRVTAVNPGVKGILEYSAYNRLTTDWPMLKESNVLDFTGNGTYRLYNSETASIGDKTAVVRIPLSSLIKNNKSLVDGKVNYHTHYYVEFMQRRPNTDAGGLYNYVLVRSAPDHRSKPGADTFFMTAMSKDDKGYGTSFYDGQHKIRVTLKSIDANGATVDISVPPGYAPTNKANTCYFSSVVDAKTVVTTNGNKACRAIGDKDLLSVGSFNGTACLTAFYSGKAYTVPPPNVEYLHCTSTPEWVKASDATMDNGFDLWGKSNNQLCRTTFRGKEQFGRRDARYCFFNADGYYNWVESSEASTTYLKWLTV